MKEALKLALEALQWSKPHGDAVITHGEAITALRLAIDVQNMASESTYKVALAQPEERNFCQRCGKRTADLTVIHTCTPPQENT
jgi:hypothetical protein